MKLVNLKTMKSKNLSEYEAFKLIQETPEEDKLKPGKHELLRTKEFILYCLNKRTRNRQKVPIRRLAALLSKQVGKLVLVDEKRNVIIVGKVKYFLADQINSPQELAYHESKGGEVICLRKSKFCKYIELDYKSLRDYYATKFTFAPWFKPILKMRSIRMALCRNGSFAFNSRRYTDTSKRSALDKFKFDVKHKDCSKIYYTLSRDLDAILDRVGKNRPLGLLVLGFDCDGSCEQEFHVVGPDGVCINCMEDANIKLVKIKEKIKSIPEFKNGTIDVRSGTKGWHTYNKNEKGIPDEITEKRYIEIQNIINEDEYLVDDFMFYKDGEKHFDLHRIFKVVNTIDAQTCIIVKEGILERINVDDKIIEVKNEKENNKS